MACSEENCKKSGFREPGATLYQRRTGLPNFEGLEWELRRGPGVNFQAAYIGNRVAVYSTPPTGETEGASGLLDLQLLELANLGVPGMPEPTRPQVK